MKFESQRFDFDIWGRVIQRENTDGAPRLQPNPLARMIELMGKRSKEPVKYTIQRDPDALTRSEIDEAFVAVSGVMARLKETDKEAHDCLTARHARRFTDARGVTWANTGLPEAIVAQAMFGGTREAARCRFKRACERGYAAHQRGVAM